MRNLFLLFGVFFCDLAFGGVLTNANCKSFSTDGKNNYCTYNSADAVSYAKRYYKTMSFKDDPKCTQDNYDTPYSYVLNSSGTKDRSKNAFYSETNTCGGDAWNNCTNFVSQALLAGLTGEYYSYEIYSKRIAYVADKWESGLKYDWNEKFELEEMNSYRWYFENMTNDERGFAGRGTAFFGAQQLYDYAIGNKDNGNYTGMHFKLVTDSTKTRYLDVSKVQIGDIIFGDWGSTGKIHHAMIVTRIDSEKNDYSRIHVTYQSSYKTDVSLDEVLNINNHNALFYVFRPTRYSERISDAPASIQEVRVSSGGTVVAGNKMTFSVIVTNAKDADRAELYFPRLNLTEKMTQKGAVFSIRREMKSPGNSIPFEVRVYKKSDKRAVTSQGSYTVQAPIAINIRSVAVLPANVIVGQKIAFTAIVDDASDVDYAELYFPDVKLAEKMLRNGTTFTFERVMTLAGNNRPFEIRIYKLSDKSAVTGKGNYTVQPPVPVNIQRVSAGPASVVVNQKMTFTAQVDNASDVDHAEIYFPDANLLEPMKQNGTTFTREREMKSVGASRVFEVRVYKKSDKKAVTKQGNYTVLPLITILKLSANPNSVRVNQKMTFSAMLDNVVDVGKVELYFPDAGVSEVMTQTGTSFSRQRVMSKVGSGRAFEVRIYRKSVEEIVKGQGKYTVN